MTGARIEAVPRELYDQARADLDVERRRSERLEKRLVRLAATIADMKRTDFGLPAEGWKPGKDADELGQYTLAAIEQFAGENRETQHWLTNQALIQQRAERLENKDASPEEIDKIVAEFIRRGDS